MNVSVDRKSHLLTYIVLGIVLLLVLGVALLSFHEAHETRQAEEKATELTAELTAAGLRAPQQDQIIRVLGDDGGAVCADPRNALRRGVLYGQLTNGAGGPGQRPVIADNRVVQGQLMIMKVYCPAYLERFQQVVDDLKFADVAGEG